MKIAQTTIHLEAEIEKNKTDKSFQPQWLRNERMIRLTNLSLASLPLSQQKLINN